MNLLINSYHSKHLLLSLIFILVSCNDIDTFNPLSNTINIENNDAISLLVDLQSELYNFEFNAAVGNTCTFPDGSQVIFAANSFLYNGQSVGSKTIKVQIRKILKKKDMTKNNTGTNSDNEILESAGMFYTEAFFENKLLELAPGVKYTIKIPANISNLPKTLEMFYGEETKYGINWKEADNDPNTQNNVFSTEWKLKDTITRLFTGIQCFPERLKWVNCDYFVKFEGKQRSNPCILPIIQPAGDQITLAAFCVFKNYNIVISPCCSKENLICFNQLPNDEDVIYVFIGKGKKNFYLGHLEKKTSKDETSQVQCEIVTLEELNQYLNSL